MTAAGLALLVAWVCAGGAVWQAARTLHYRVVRTEGRREAARDTLRIAQGDVVHWVEHDEVRFEGRMFDVEQPYREAGCLVLVGHFDDWDAELFAVLDGLFEDDPDGAPRLRIFLPEALPPPAPFVVSANEFSAGLVTRISTPGAALRSAVANVPHAPPRA